MNTNTKIAKESAISFTGMGFGQVFRYLFTTLLARWAGVELLGLYSISNAVTRIMEVIGKLKMSHQVQSNYRQNFNILNQNLAVAQSVTLKPIEEIASHLGLPSEHLESYGRVKAKIALDSLSSAPAQQQLLDAPIPCFERK